MLAITTVVASIVVSCKNKIGEADKLDLSRTPTQQTYDMFAVQTQNGVVVSWREWNTRFKKSLSPKAGTPTT